MTTTTVRTPFARNPDLHPARLDLQTCCDHRLPPPAINPGAHRLAHSLARASPRPRSRSHPRRRPLRHDPGRHQLRVRVWLALGRHHDRLGHRHPTRRERAPGRDWCLGLSGLPVTNQEPRLHRRNDALRQLDPDGDVPHADCTRHLRHYFGQFMPRVSAPCRRAHVAWSVLVSHADWCSQSVNLSICQSVNLCPIWVFRPGTMPRCKGWSGGST